MTAVEQHLWLSFTSCPLFYVQMLLINLFFVQGIHRAQRVDSELTVLLEKCEKYIKCELVSLLVLSYFVHYLITSVAKYVL